MPRSNPEERRVWMRDYYRDHRTEIAAQKQGYYQAHAEARRAYQREYRRRSKINGLKKEQ